MLVYILVPVCYFQLGEEFLILRCLKCVEKVKNVGIWHKRASECMCVLCHWEEKFFGLFSRVHCLLNLLVGFTSTNW